MSPLVRQGIIWGLGAGFVSAACYMAFSFAGGLLLGPLIALTASTVAAYRTIGHTGRQRPIRTGALTGLITGGILLLSLMLFAVVLVVVALNEPSAPAFQAQLTPSFVTLGLDPAAAPIWIVAAALFISFCLGSVNVVIAIVFGTLSGWMVARQQRQSAAHQAASTSAAE